MFIRHALLGTALFALSSAIALAAPATGDEAARLTALFQTYVGAEPGVVTVAPSGDAYTVTFDFAPFIAKASSDTFTGTITPYVMTLTDNDDGTWATSVDQAFAADFTVTGLSAMSYKMGSIKGSGIFDETLAAFTTSRTDFTDISITQVMSLPDAPPTNSSTTASSGYYESAAVASTVKGVDSTVSYALTDYAQTMAMPGAPGSAPSEILITAQTYGATGAIKGFQPDAFYKLIAWFVAHPSEAAIKADQAGLKAVLTEGMPFFQNIDTTGAMENVTIGTPVGVFAVDKLGIAVTVNGLIADGLFREAITVSGLTVPEGLLPAWSADLVPTAFGIDVTGSGFDAAAPAAAFIAAFDLTKPDPVDPATSAQMMAAFLPKGTVDITLAPGNITAPSYNLTYEGAMTAGPGGLPTGTAKVTMTGMDAVLAALQSGPPEMTGQIVPALVIAKGIATAEADGALVWNIDASTPGTLLVNGLDAMAIMGGQ